MTAAPLIAVGGSAWRNRPLAALESEARGGLTPATVIALDPADLRTWVPSLWPAAEVRDPGDFVLGMRIAALGVELPAGVEPAVRPDLAVLHYPFADEDGAVYLRGTGGDAWFDRLIVEVARRVIVTVDEVLTRAQGRRAASSRRWDAGEFAEVRHVPYGAFPGSCDGLYRSDEGRRDPFAGWVAVAAADERDRLEVLTTPAALAAVSLPHGLEWPGR